MSVNFMLTRTDQEAMLARVHEHLADDGLFLVDNMPLHPNQMVDEPEDRHWYTLSHPNGREIHAAGRGWFDHYPQLYLQQSVEESASIRANPCPCPFSPTNC